LGVPAQGFVHQQPLGVPQSGKWLPNRTSSLSAGLGMLSWGAACGMLHGELTHCAGDTELECLAEGESESPMESAAAHAARHPGFQGAGCSRCKFLRNYTPEAKSQFKSKGIAWKNACTFRDAKGAAYTWLVEKPAARSGIWGCGCFPCARYSKHAHSSFAKLEVHGLQMMNVTELRRHGEEPGHRDACQALWEDEAPLLSTLRVQSLDAVVERLVGTRKSLTGVPRPEKWLWAAATVETACTQANYEKFCKTHCLD